MKITTFNDDDIYIDDFARYEKVRHRARGEDPDTSRKAAGTVIDDKGGHHYVIWRIVNYHGPLTSEQICGELEKRGLLSSRSGTRTRIKRLERDEWLVIVKDKFGETAKGNRARLYRAEVPQWKRMERFRQISSEMSDDE